MVRFFDRVSELRLLGREWNSRGSAFIVVFGRRRIGKTRLLDEFLSSKGGVKFSAEDVNKKIQINEFRQVVASFLKDDFLAGQEFNDWGSLFSYLAKVLPKDKRVFLWIDEFSYLVKNDSSITSVLQKFVDGFLRESRIFFVASGSLFGLMSEKVLSHSSPLYGRRTRDILLEPIPSPHVKEFLGMGFEDALKAELTLNGIPEYLLIASKYKSYSGFIKNEFFKTTGYFFREPLYLLSQEFKEIKTYFSIINAIAYGNTKPTDIANFAGLKSREIYPYLELLISFGFVKRETSAIGDKKKGIYLIKDNFFDFWFNFVHKNREKIERNTFKPNNQELNQFLGKRFEIFIRDNFQAFFNNFDDIGKWWQKDKEIDIVASSKKNKKILFGECKWQEKTNAMQIAKKLNEKTQFLETNNKKQSIAIFAKSFSKRINKFEEKRVYCFDLKDIEKTLQKTKQQKQSLK